jgi:hypothetical protein
MRLGFLTLLIPLNKLLLQGFETVCQLRQHDEEKQELVALFTEGQVQV